MGFLSGVLDAVKKENEVTTYDNYITKPDKKLNEVLDLLTTKIGSGRTGLVASVDAVKGWLEGYGREVKEKINDVKNPINNLEKELERQKQSFEKLKNKEYDASKYAELAECIRNLDNLIEKSDESSTCLRSLDTRLRNELKLHVKNICLATHTFRDNAISDNAGLAELCKNVKVEVDDMLKNAIEVALKAQNKCIETLKKEFYEKIYWPIVRVKDAVENVKSQLRKWITDAYQVLNICMGNTNQVHSKLDPHGKKTEHEIGTNINDISQAKSTIMDINSKLNEIDGSLGTWITQAELIVGNALSNVKSILKNINDTKKTTISEAISKLKNETQMHLLNRKNAELKSISQQAGDYLDTLVSAIEVLVDVTFSGVHEQYEAWVNGQSGRPLSQLSGYIDQLKYISTSIYQAAHDISKQDPMKVVPSYGPLSTSQSLSISLRTLYQLHSKQREPQCILNPRTISTKPSSATQAAEHFKILSSLATTTRQVMSDAVNFLKVKIQNAPISTSIAINADMNNFYDIARSFTDALRDAERFAQHLQQLHSHVQIGPVNNVIENIKHANEHLQQMSRDILSFGHDFTTQKSLVEQLVQTANDNLTQLTEDVSRAAGEKNNGLHNALTELLNRYFKKPSVENGSDANNDSIHIIHKGLTDQQGQLPAKTSSITAATKTITEQLNNLRTTLNTQVACKLKDFRDKGLIDTDQWDVNGDHARGLANILHDIDLILESDNPSGTSLVGIMIAGGKFAEETVPNTIRNCIDTITSKLSEEAELRIKNIHKDALKQFAESKVEELIRLKKMVTEHNDHLSNAIINDLNQGIKGLLKTMSNNQGTLDAFTTPASLKLNTASDKVQIYLEQLFEYIKCEVSIFDGDIFKPTNESTRVKSIQKMVHDLIGFLAASRHFDHTFHSNLNNLQYALHDFAPKNFGDLDSPLLAPLKSGLSNFTEQLGLAYVSRYSGEKLGDLTTPKPIDKAATHKQSIANNYDLTPEGRNCAKVCLTIVEILGHDLGELRKRCQKGDTYKHNKVCLRADKLENPLGAFLTECGYRVPSGDGSKQDGELKWKGEWTGEEINKKLVEKKFKLATEIKHMKDCESNKNGTDALKKSGDFDIIDIFECIMSHIKDYYCVSHLGTSTAKKQPSSVHEMLVWLAGLPHNPVHRELTFTYFSELFDKPKQVPINISGDIISIEDTDDVPLSAYPEDVTPGKLTGALTGVCAHAHSTLTAILGHGHKDGIYAVDFNTNEYKLSYPSNTAACFDMLTDIVCRLYQQLIFIYYQCCDTTEVGGWRNCWYGNSIGGSSWKCNDIQCADQKCNQNAYQIANQIHDQNGDQHPQCGLKSPLQSFLEDGLPGFLPHSFTKPGCKLECTVSKHRGIPCITPMGFADLSDMASHRQSGKHLCAILADFCGSKNSCLTRICGYVICLLGNAPQTLDEMFSFYHNMLFEWNTKRIGREQSTKHKRDAFEDSVKTAYFGVPYPELNVDSVFVTREHTNGSLLCLVGCNDHSLMTCGRFLRPIGFNTWDVFSAKNAGLYLSWVTYITESFYDLLQKLYDECCNKCDKPGTRCHDKSCVETCRVKSYYASRDSNKRFTDQKHSDKCHSIAKCRNMRPMLYKSGLMLARPYDLTGANEQLGKIRTCKDFCAALEKVLNKEEQLQRVLPKLVYVTIPEFLWKIREPFSYLVLALWLLSFLYLLHIMVVRLDLLHIKSHLRSPSSHRIAAQSLLAAARVNKLNRVFYLQP